MSTFSPADGQDDAQAKSHPASSTTPCCPHCHSTHIDTLNRARKTGSVIGSVAGAAGGMAAMFSGAETGALVGVLAGPPSMFLGGIAGAVIAGLIGSAAGCMVGSAVGSAIDENALDNHVCRPAAIPSVQSRTD